MSDAGVKMGIPREMSTQFAAQTVLGAAKMVIDTNKHTGQLKDEVCSPGGTTITGIHELEKGGVRWLFKNVNINKSIIIFIIVTWTGRLLWMLSKLPQRNQ